MLTSAPTLVTDRLTMRAIRRDDFADCAAMWADPLVARFLGGSASTVEESWTRLQRMVGHWSLMGYGYWLVRASEGDRFVGLIGFGNNKRAVVPPLGDAPEIGWVLAAWAHGRGYATEAALAALDWLERERGRERTVCMIVPENTASIRVAEKLGYRAFAQSSYQDRPSVLFERL